MSKGVVSLVEASTRLCIGHTRTYELIRDGKLAAYKQGARTVVTVESIDALIEELVPFVSKAKARIRTPKPPADRAAPKRKALAVQKARRRARGHWP